MMNGIAAVQMGQTAVEKLNAKNEKEDFGSVGNRIDYATKMGVHLKKSSAKDAFVSTAGLAATVGATAAVAKSKTLQNKIGALGKKLLSTNAAKSVKKDLGEIATKAAPFAKKALDIFIALPKPAKAVLGIGVALTSLASLHTNTKSMVEAGQIKQEALTNAKIQKAFNA